MVMGVIKELEQLLSEMEEKINEASERSLNVKKKEYVAVEAVDFDFGFRYMAYNTEDFGQTVKHFYVKGLLSYRNLLFILEWAVPSFAK